MKVTQLSAPAAVEFEVALDHPLKVTSDLELCLFKHALVIPKVGLQLHPIAQVVCVVDRGERHTDRYEPSAT